MFVNKQLYGEIIANSFLVSISKPTEQAGNKHIPHTTRVRCHLPIQFSELRVFLCKMLYISCTCKPSNVIPKLHVLSLFFMFNKKN
jgi:hypothetical protein